MKLPGVSIFSEYAKKIKRQSRSSPGIQRSLLCTKKYKKTDYDRKKKLNKQ